MGAAYIEPAQCHGCGVCVAECPAKAIQLLHYRDGQIEAKIEALEGVWVESVAATNGGGVVPKRCQPACTDPVLHANAGPDERSEVFSRVVR